MFFRRMKSLVGLDIGSSAVKAVELRQTARGYKVAAIGSEPLPPDSIVDGAIIDGGVVADVIRQVFEKNHIKTKEVVASLSGNAVIVKKIVLPLMSEEALAESIYWEAEQYIPFDIQDVNLDYQALESGADEVNLGTMAVLLVAASDRTITGYAWNFGDSSTGTGVTTSHTFATAGVYNVVLTVTDNQADTATTSSQVTVTRGPTASFTASPSPTPQGSLTIVDAAASTASDGATITSYAWNFGDTTGTTTCPGGAGCVVATPWILSHTYAAAASYTITLTVTDSLGQSATTTQTLTVGAVNDPTASFTVSPNPAATSAVIIFNGSGSSASGSRTITSYSWNWGDGTADGTGVTATHSFTSAGTFTVTLTVTDSASATGQTTVAVTIS